MKEGEKEDEIDVNIEIPYKILKDILDSSRKRKEEDSIDCRNCKVYILSHRRHHDTAAILGEGLRDLEGDRKNRLKECKGSIGSTT